MAKAELYKITINDGKVMLRIPQQLVGAETASMDDIQAELHLRNLDYVPEQLLEIYNRTSGEFDYLADVETNDYTLQIELSEDESRAYVNIIPPSEEGDPLTMELIIAALEGKNIFQGISSKNIKNIIADKIFYEPALVASGKSVVHGKNGYPELLFIPEKSRPALGTAVKLEEVTALQKVEEGQELVRLMSATMGENGYSITGKMITAKSGKQYRIRPGRNTRYNPEGTHIIATKSGVVCLNNDSISVEKIKVVDKVDASTGHLRFDGIVKIRGNVADRCSVEAVRIDIGGSVGKARLRSLGEIRVAHGIKGAIVQCGRSLHTSDMTDTQANVGEHLLVDDFVLNSKVFCGSTLQVTGPYGYVYGGVIQAGNLILLPNVGLPGTKETKSGKVSEENSEPHTILEVGITTNNRKQFNELEKLTDTSMDSLQDNITEIDTILEQLEDGGWDEKKIETLSEFETKAEKNVISAFTNLRKRETHIEIKDLNRISNGGVVFITGKILTGTAINVRRSRFNVPVTATDKAYSFDENGIKFNSCKELLKNYQQYFFRMPT